MWTQCPYGQRVVSSTCQACHSTCAVCSGPGSTQCTECSWKGNTQLAGDFSCSDSCATSSGLFTMFGTCQPCTGSCNTCPFNRCTSASCIGTEVLYPSASTCCNIADRKFFFSNTNTCMSCNGICKNCFSGAFDHCLTCASGEAVNFLTNQCVSSCDQQNGKWVDIASGGTCKSCATGCKECMSNLQCLRCDTAGGYTLNNGICSSCATTNGKFVNSLYNPPRCDDCSANCKQCDDAQKCTICDTAGGFTLQSGDVCIKCPSNCLTCSSTTVCTGCDTANNWYINSNSGCSLCDVANGKYIPAAGNQCLDCQVQGCKACPSPSGSTCTSCDTSANYYLTGLTCALCQVKNGFYLNTGNNPPTCHACQVSDCLECTGGGAAACTSCNSAAGFYQSGGVCLSCAITNGFFISSAGTACSFCPDNCLECSDSSTCTKCDAANNYLLVNGRCLTCDLEGGNFLSGPQDTCEKCVSRCRTCETAAENCLTCRAGFEKFRLLDGSRDTCLSTNEAEEIRSLAGDESLTDLILRNSTLTWTISRKAINDLGEYRVAFSAVDLIFSDFDEANLKNEMKVRKN